jgi:hypothetical protein
LKRTQKHRFLSRGPNEQVERPLPNLVVLPDDQQFLTRRSIIAAGHIAELAIADIKAIDDGEAKGS